MLAAHSRNAVGRGWAARTDFDEPPKRSETGTANHMIS